jgi:hypothetical protein
MEDKVKAVLKSEPKTNKELREALGLNTSYYDPKLDRMLQKMRKTGEIQVINGKWSLASFKICDKCKGKGWVEK